MKKLLIIILCTYNFTFSQDVIISNNGKEINPTISISNNTFEETEIQDEVIVNINSYEANKIISENKKSERVDKESTPLSEVIDENIDEGNYFTIGVGYGLSYGGYGIRGQYRMGRDQRFGVHLGAGYSFDGAILASAGLKYFAYNDFYINAQFGMTGYDVTDEYYDGILYGPSVLIGMDKILWDNKYRFGINAAVGATYNINYWYDDDEFEFPIDFGIFMSF